MAERFKLARVVTASSWQNATSAIADRLRRMRGTTVDSNGTIALRMTNREALAIVAAIRALSPMLTNATEQAKFRLWYQFAAAAYGWTPESDRLVTSSAQADKPYDPDATVELELALMRIGAWLDRERADVPARIELDQGAWDDVVFQGEVRRALQDDGAEAFLIPACKRDGKRGQFPKRNKKTGKWECDVEVINPIGETVRRLVPIAVAVGIFYILAPAVLGGAIAGHVSNSRRGRRNRRN